MLEIYKFDRPTYTLLVIESKNFTALDIERLKNVCPSVDGTKGVAIAGAPETNWTAIGDLFSFYSNRSQWQGAYSPDLHGILVGNGFGNVIRGEVIKMKLPCLECCRQGRDTEVKAGAKYPYCTEHYHRSPHRSGSRSKKS